MMRFCVLVGILSLALCAIAQAQTETVVVTASFAGPRATEFLKESYARLTPEGRDFVDREAKQLHDGTMKASAAHYDAASRCTLAFGSCGERDTEALTALILERGLIAYLIADLSAMRTLTPGQETESLRQAAACGYDTKCARDAMISALPPDRRHAVKRMWSRDRKIQKALEEALASAGYDQKDDK
jgi:hypothetical protein